MKLIFKVFAGISVFVFFLFFIAIPVSANASPAAIVSRFATLGAVKLHYLTGGHGPAAILLLGYTQTLALLLAGKFTVIAPDLPGIGDSKFPKDKVDMNNAAVRIHELVKALGVPKARVVGHDIGLMVAYAYAAQFPAETEKLVVMDAFLPGVPGWEAFYNDPGTWHFRFTKRFCTAFSNEANHAGPCDRWRESKWNCLGRTDEDCGYQCDDGRPKRLRPLDAGRKAQRNDGRTRKLPLKFGARQAPRWRKVSDVPSTASC